MSVSPSPVKQELQNLEWFRECITFLNKNGDKEKSEQAEKIFIETYFENIQEGMKHTEALQKAKLVAFCFLMLNKS